MKQFCIAVITAIIFSLIKSGAFAQPTITVANIYFMHPYPISVTYSKTTHLIFPYSIKSVDRGSRDVLVQKAKGVENVLQLKAAKENFNETSVSVITGDGRLYSFLVNYSARPSQLIFSFLQDSTRICSSYQFREPVIIDKINEAEIEQLCKQIQKKNPFLHSIRSSRYKTSITLNGIYIKENTLFFRFALQNDSQINYDINRIWFFILDKKQIKRTAEQQVEVTPLYIYGNWGIIKGRSKQLCVFALPKFTIPYGKHFIIQLQEKNGGRHLKLKVPNRALMKAKAIMD